MRTPVVTHSSPSVCGRTRRFRPEQTNIFFKLMEERYRRKSTIITPNLDFPEWQTFRGNKALVDALLSRLRHQCHTIRIDGPSLRDTFGRALRPAYKRSARPPGVAPVSLGEPDTGDIAVARFIARHRLQELIQHEDFLAVTGCADWNGRVPALSLAMPAAIVAITVPSVVMPLPATV
jgi:hypothetical protein